ncbi:MAG: hypothetical protein ABWY78_06460 [Microvirga sp.]
MTARGFVLVRDDTRGGLSYYLDRSGCWDTTARDPRIFPTTAEARAWIRNRGIGYWLTSPAPLGRPRVISARAAGL